MNTRSKINKYIKKWLDPLGLAWWSVTVRYIVDPGEIVLAFKAPTDDTVVAAKVEADWKYGTATLSVNLPAFDNIPEDKIEHIIVHELVHILVNEMREQDIHHEERVVTNLTKAFLWTAVESKKWRQE